MSDKISRKKFFYLGGMAGIMAALIKKQPLKRTDKGNGTVPEIKSNPLAVKREKRGNSNA